MPFASEDGAITARLDTEEAGLLRDLTGQLIELLANRSTESAESANPADLLLAQLGIGGSADAPLDPALARLLPDAYRGDDEAASEHRQLTELGLIDRKIGNAQALLHSLDGDGQAITPAAVRLDDSAVQSWLRTLTDLRLTLAARLEIEVDGDEGRDETELDHAMQGVYNWLGYLQSMLLDAIDTE